MATIGLEGVLLEACLTSCVSIKKYGRSLHCHKTVLECLERLLFEQFLLCRNEDMVGSSLPVSSKGLLQLLESPWKEYVDASLNVEGTAGYLMEFHLLKCYVRDGSLGKMLNFGLTTWTKYGWFCHS